MRTPALQALIAGAVLNLSFQANATPTLSRRDLGTLCPPENFGKLKCVDSNHFVICNDGFSVVQSMGPGVICDEAEYLIPHRMRRDIGSLCPPEDIGKLKCVDSNNFVICNGGFSVAQPMAPGVICNEADYVAPAPAPHRMRRDVGSLCPPEDIGKLKCVDTSNFVICNGGFSVAQPMAPGVICNEADYAAPAPHRSRRDLGSLCPPEDFGKFKCVDSSNFVLCNGGFSVTQPMAPGVTCDDGIYQAPGPSPAPNRMRRDLGSLCPQSDIGKFKCVDNSNFVICNGGHSVAQAMAPGVSCNDGGIVHNPAPAPAPAPPPPPASTPPPPPPPPAPTPTRSFTTTGPTSFNCVQKLQPKVLGQSVVGMFYCLDDWSYVTCTDGDAPVYGVHPGQLCKQQKDQSYAVVDSHAPA